MTQQLDMDLEFLVDRFTNAVESNLNTCITNLNARKALTDTVAKPEGLGLSSDIVLDPIPSGAFHWLMTENKIPDRVPYVLYRLSSSPELQAGQDNSQSSMLMVTIVVSDKSKRDPQILNRRLLRYRRALRFVLNAEGLKSNLDGFKLIPLDDDLLFHRNSMNFWGVPIVAAWKFG